ncbi:TonB-dependent receptor [Phenylobacterium sp.]|uniref:TonB-dependent receptor domain-containing protein n=1 Tax=Phenylobacterium sp. TaxID=1871053 RepID=UPI0025F5DDDA|nr:TonB-dependent receptor [Phenylobacterium sp.]MBX3483146.1 TonB-dependent receptor [Phenylobacterium sp.]MCW5760304.1 TonB-dependent receptor [Phenylobacterium sp.]
MGGVALACAAGRTADAAESRLRVQIPPRTYADALIDLGLQANVSILGTASCGSGGRVEVSGRYTLEEALGRILAGAPCRYRIVDARTVRITAAPPLIELPPTRDPPHTQTVVAEVMVTATKRPAAPNRLPAGVSAISRDQIASTRANDVGQTIGQLAGVLSTNLGPGRDKLLIRGLSDGAFTGRTRTTVSTYLDDAPINFNAPDPDLRLVDVERIEVVRGPQGALYGSGSIAGIYKIVTAKPDLAHMEAGASASIATTKGGGTSHDIDGYLSVPIVHDRIGVRLAAYREVQGGYLDDLVLRSTNVDQTRRDGGRLSVRVQFDDHWRLDALAATQHLRSNDTQYVISPMTAVTRRMPGMPQEAGDGAVGAPDGRGNRIRETHNNDFSSAGATLNGEYGWGSVTSSTNFIHHVFSSQYDATATRGLFAADLAELGVYGETTRSNMFVQDLVARSENSGRLDWLIGVYAARTVARTPSSLAFLAPGVVQTAYMENRKDRLSEYALYGEATYDLGDGWTASLGGRTFESRVRTTADLRIRAPFASRFFDQKRGFDGFSPKISLQREFTNGDLVYALVTEGYRPGGFNSSGFLPIRAARTTFRPDRLRNFELGAKFRRLDNRLIVRTAAYYDDWANIQTDQYRQSGLAYTANVGDARILGVEAEVSYDFPFGLSLQANGLVSDSKVRNINPDFPTTPTTRIADKLPGVPDLSAGLLAVYRRPLNDALTLRLVGEASYVGRSGLSFDQPPRTDQYLRTELSAEVSGNHWRLTAFVTNPLNDDGDTFSYGNPFSFADDPTTTDVIEAVRQATPQRPRTFGLRLAAAF